MNLCVEKDLVEKDSVAVAVVAVAVTAAATIAEMAAILVAEMTVTAKLCNRLAGLLVDTHQQDRRGKARQ